VEVVALSMTNGDTLGILAISMNIINTSFLTITSNIRPILCTSIDTRAIISTANMMIEFGGVRYAKRPSSRSKKLI